MKKFTSMLALAVALVMCVGLMAACTSGNEEPENTTTQAPTVKPDKNETPGTTNGDAGSDDAITDDEITDDEITDDETADDEITDDEITDDEITDDEITDDEITDDEITDDENGDKEVSGK